MHLRYIFISQVNLLKSAKIANEVKGGADRNLDLE